MKRYEVSPITMLTWPGPRNPSKCRSGESSIALIVGNDRDVIAKQREVFDPFFFRAQHSECSAGHGCLEAQCKEDDLPVRVLFGDLQRVEGRVDHAHVGAIGFGLEQAFFRSGYPHRVSERGEDHAGHVGQCDAVVDSSHRQHANRAAGAVDQLDAIGQHCLHTVAEDGVCVTAADFHDVDRATAITSVLNLGDENANLFEQKPRLLRISEFVDVFHVVFFLVCFSVKRSTGF